MKLRRATVSPGPMLDTPIPEARENCPFRAGRTVACWLPRPLVVVIEVSPAPKSNAPTALPPGVAMPLPKTRGPLPTKVPEVEVRATTLDAPAGPAVSFIKNQSAVWGAARPAETHKPHVPATAIATNA